MKTNIEELAEGFAIFSKKEYKADVCYQHDVVRVLVQDEVSEEDEKKLLELNWGFDDEERDWYHF